MTQIDTGLPSMRPIPRTAASRRPVRELGRDDSVRVGLLVGEPERIDGLQAGVALLECALVEEQLEPRPGREPEVMSAARADTIGLVELLVEQHLRAAGALGPQVGRVGVLAGPKRGQLDGHRG